MRHALRVIMITLILGCGLLGFVTVAEAEDGEIKATAPWSADGFAFPIDDDRVYMVAVYSGTIFVDKGEGVLHTGSIVCPGTVTVDLSIGKKSGQGHCIITNQDGHRVYAEFTCTGDFRGCAGPFTLVGGTGKFTGITGEGEMISQLELRDLRVLGKGVVGGFESAHLHGEGVAVWPKLTYRIPDAQ